MNPGAPPQNLQDLTWRAYLSQRLTQLHNFLFGAGALQKAAGYGQQPQQPPQQFTPAYDDPLAIQKMAQAMADRQLKKKKSEDK